MTADNSNKEIVKNINNFVISIKNIKNAISGILLDETLTECFYLKEEITIPPIPVKELDYSTGFEILKNLAGLIPEYLCEHELLEKRKPLSEQHTLQFIKPITGRVIDFVHILRLDFKLSGGYGTITGKGDPRIFPQFRTDRIKYKSRLVPVLKGSDPLLLDSIRLKTQFGVDADGKRFTSVLFDEYSTAEISQELSLKAGDDVYSIPVKIYPFIAYDYFTACLNIPDPSASKITIAADIFEPLFFMIYFYYRESLPGIEKEMLSAWGECFDVTETGISQKPLLQEKLRDFFSRYSVYRDEQLMLAGLRKLAVNE